MRPNRTCVDWLCLAFCATGLTLGGCRTTPACADETRPADIGAHTGPLIRYERRVSAHGVEEHAVDTVPYGVSPGVVTIPGKERSDRQDLPRFYRGSNELAYTVGKDAGGMELFFEFPAFRTEFGAFNYGIPANAVTKSKTGRLLAAVKSIRFFPKNESNGQAEQGVEIQEVHYDAAGKVSFRALSEIDAYSGFKLSERVICGEKQNEYYFVWPHLQY